MEPPLSSLLLHDYFLIFSPLLSSVSLSAPPLSFMYWCERRRDHLSCSSVDVGGDETQPPPLFTTVANHHHRRGACVIGAVVVWCFIDDVDVTYWTREMGTRPRRGEAVKTVPLHHHDSPLGVVAVHQRSTPPSSVSCGRRSHVDGAESHNRVSASWRLSDCSLSCESRNHYLNPSNCYLSFADLSCDGCDLPFCVQLTRRRDQRLDRNYLVNQDISLFWSLFEELEFIAATFPHC